MNPGTLITAKDGRKGVILYKEDNFPSYVVWFGEVRNREFLLYLIDSWNMLPSGSTNFPQFEEKHDDLFLAIS